MDTDNREAAQIALRLHVASRSARADDLRMAGSPMQPGLLLTMLGLVGVGVGLVVGMMYGVGGRWLVMTGVVMLPLLAIVVAVLLFRWTCGLFLPSRQGDRDPVSTVQHCLRAGAWSFAGRYAACLAPSARALEVMPPKLGPVLTGGGVFTVTNADAAGRYLRTFWCSGAGVTRRMRVHRCWVLDEPSRDSAVVAAELTLHTSASMAREEGTGVGKQGMTLLMVLGWVAVLFHGVMVIQQRGSLRAGQRLRLLFGLLRGDDGLWYLTHPGWPSVELLDLRARAGNHHQGIV